MSDCCCNEALPIYDPGEDRFPIFYVFKLDQNIQKFFQGLDLIRRFEVIYDLIGF